MPEENLKPSEELIDVGETVGAEINLDEKEQNDGNVIDIKGNTKN